MLKKFTISLTGIFFFALWLAIPQTFAEFRDVAQDAPYFPAVNYYEKMKIIQGTGGQFFPDRYIKRIEFIKILMGRIDEQEDLSYITIPYKDLNSAEWYAPFIKLALKKGVIRGADEFFPNDNITYFEGIQLTYRYYKNVVLPAVSTRLNAFSDINLSHLSSTFPALEKAVEDKLITPIDEHTLRMYRTLTRADAVQLLYTAKGLYQFTETQSSPIDSYFFSNVPSNLKDIFLDVFQKLHNNYLYSDLLNDEMLVYASIEGMVRGLDDPYSVFFPPEASQSFLRTAQGNVEGIGAYVDLVNGQIHIVSPLKDSPADKAGVLPDDVIISIDGESTENMSLSQAVAKIRGPKGTVVKLEIQRKNVEQHLFFDITRDQVRINSVEYKDMGAGIAYFDILQFTPITPSEFTDAYNQNLTIAPKGMILDLRNNPGGYLDSALFLLGNFIKKEKTAVRIKDNKNITSITSYGTGWLDDIPLIVLINKGSASASEIVASALKDYKQATIIGEKSYGKGVVQQLYEYANGSSLKLTVSEWLPPLSDSINKKGIEPDIAVLNDPNNKTVDNQLTKALEILR